VSGPIAEASFKKSRRQKSAVREAVVRFSIFSLIALLVLVVATILLGSRIARQEALREAGTRGYAIANLIAAPLVNSKVRAHVPGASDELTTIMRNRMSDGSIVHAKLWDANGEVLWSDETALVGRQFPLDQDVKDLFGTRTAVAEVTDLSKPENGQERGLGELLEVYAGAHDADNVPMVFEVYFSAARMREDEGAIVGGLLPIVIGALLLFQMAVLPLALSLARRVERGLEERSSLMRHALLGYDLERRRIAQDLHDGVVQDLAGLSYAMPTLEAQFADSPAAPAARDTVHKISEILTRDVAALRSMITDIYPPDLKGPGFAAALQDLARSAGERGIQVQVEMAPDLSVPLDATRLAYRIAREGLRNVAKHAHATAATVQVGRDDDLMFVSVSDNGRGLADEEVKKGHLGLRLLEDTVQDLGGQVTLHPSPSGGAVLEASFPVSLV
jgi:signal transduction histidine kinase